MHFITIPKIYMLNLTIFSSCGTIKQNIIFKFISKLSLYSGKSFALAVSSSAAISPLSSCNEEWIWVSPPLAISTSSCSAVH